MAVARLGSGVPADIIRRGGLPCEGVPQPHAGPV